MQVLIPNSELPSKAGKANIHFQDETVCLISRKDKDILLPLRNRGKFYPLKGGSQFIFDNRCGDDSNRIFFGGTDENVFLVRINPGPLEIFNREGEEKFFEALKPLLIRRLENQLHIVAKRQGDIFALKMPFNEKMIKSFMVSLFSFSDEPDKFNDEEIELVDLEKEKVFGTRHLFTGSTISIDRETRCPGLSEDKLKFFSGVLQAPDHTDLIINDGIYLLGQTRFLADPKGSD